MAASEALGRRRSRRAPRAGDEGGFTLPELLIAAMIGLLVIGAGVAAFTTGVRSEPRISQRAYDIQQARTTMERISRELRQAYDVPTGTASTLEVLTYVKRTVCGGSEVGPADRCRVTYTCAEGSCTRTEVDPDNPGAPAPVTVVSGLQSDAVFSYAGGGGVPPYVGIRLVFPASGGDDSITLDDGVSLRNPLTPLGGPS